jgi:hypothetical protein
LVWLSHFENPCFVVKILGTGVALEIDDGSVAKVIVK